MNCKRVNISILDDICFQLWSGSSWDTYKDVKITYREIYKSKVGDTFVAEDMTTCNRVISSQKLTVVYRDEFGVLCKLDEWGTENTPNVVEYRKDAEFFWVTFNK